MEIFEEGNPSSRFSLEWCEEVISGNAGEDWETKKEYYPAILLLLKTYEIETIRFDCDW